MTLKPEEEALLVRYLLDDLPEEERVRIEIRYFQDDEFFLEANALEEELIRDYLRSNLSPSQRVLFERRYLNSPVHRDRVDFARALMSASSSHSGSPLPRTGVWRRLVKIVAGPPGITFRAVTGGALALALCGLAWLGISSVELRRRIELLEAERAGSQARVQRIPVAVSFALSPGLARSDERLRRLLVPAEAEVVQLELDLDAGVAASAWRAVVTTPEGIETWSGSASAPRPGESSRTVTVSIPARQLPTGDFVLALNGAGPGGSFEPVESYSFRVVRQP